MTTPIDDPLEVYEIISASIGETFSLRELLKVIERVFTGKQIIVERVPLPPDVTGRSFNLLDCIVIHLNQSLDHDHAQVVCCHELGHVIFNHIQLVHLHFKEFMKAFYQGQLDTIPAAYRKHRTIFDAPQEQAAEDLGILLIECIERWESTLPGLAQDIYGD